MGNKKFKAQIILQVDEDDKNWCVIRGDGNDLIDMVKKEMGRNFELFEVLSLAVVEFIRGLLDDPEARKLEDMLDSVRESMIEERLKQKGKVVD